MRGLALLAGPVLRSTSSTAGTSEVLDARDLVRVALVHLDGLDRPRVELRARAGVEPAKELGLPQRAVLQRSAGLQRGAPPFRAAPIRCVGPYGLLVASLPAGPRRA